MARILYFGRLGDVLGVSSEACALPSNIRDTARLRAYLDTSKKLNGALLENSVRVAVNNELVQDPAPISDTDEIAFMPPVGGG